MTNGLPSVNAKLNRGDEHFKRLNAEIAAWKDRAPWTIKSERDDDSRRFVVGICFDEYLDLLHWGLLLGEVLYNYRCALDHQAYLLACRHTGKESSPILVETL